MDDLGYSELRSDGALDVRTPHLDRLVADGVRLTQCYAAAPVCTPTRAAFMTGRYQHRLGLESVISAAQRNEDRGLSPTEPTLPAYLKRAGYVTGLVGKWHLGRRPEFRPNRHGIDEFFGRILATLDRLGLRRNTLVIFTSDNGGEWLSRMEPLFHRKGTLWEGGLRVPCVLRWPAALPAGRVSPQPAITMDLTATILAAAGVTVAPERPLDGVDLLPLVTRAVPRTFYWRGVRAGSPEKAIREGRWKYVTQSPLFPGLLFDIEADPSERHDLAARHPDVLRRLQAKHEEWTRSMPAASPGPAPGPAPGPPLEAGHGREAARERKHR